MRHPAVARPLLALLVAGCAHARSPLEGEIVTDRPDFTESVEVVPRGHAQLESGATSAHAGDEHVVSAGEVLYRHGLSARTELRLGLNSWTQAKSKAPGGVRRGFEDASVGAKVVMGHQPHPGSLVPSTSVIVATTVPTGATPYRSRALQPEVKLLLDWTVTERFGVGSNVNAYSVPDGAGRRRGEYSLSLVSGYDITDRFGVYTEYIGHFTPAQSVKRQHWASGGFSYLLSRNLQVDLRAGHVVHRDRLGDDDFVGLGLSTRW